MIALLCFLQAAWAGVVAASPRGDLDSVYAPRRVAVLVGVQDYADPALQGLRYSTKDANDLATVLRSPDVGGFDEVQVITTSKATSRIELRKAILAAAANLQRDDTFLLYLSGHGTLTLDPAEGSRLWFLPSDARLDAPEQTGLAIADLEELVSSLPARRRVLILDTCHNGRSGSKSFITTATASRLQGLRGELPAPRGDREVSESEARLYAAQYYQPAMEDPTLQNGVYTHFLIEGLTSGRGDSDLDGDGLVDVTEAHEYARDHTIAYTGALQVPRAEYRIVGREEIFLAGRESARSAAEQALLSACDLVLNRARLLVNGIPRGEFPGLYAIEPGNQRIEVQTADGRTLLDERVRFEAGATTPIEDLLRAKKPSFVVSAGVAALGGTDYVHPFTPSLALTWVRPIRMSGAWRPDLHVAVAAGEGPLEGVPATTGDVLVGATLAREAGVFWLGPTVDERVPFRSDHRNGELQVTVATNLGISAGVDVPVSSGLALQVRADGFGSLQREEQAWTPMYGGALRIGFSSRP